MTTAKKETLLEAAARRGLYYSPDEHIGSGDDDERAPPGADAMEIAEKLVTDWDNTNPALTMTELVAEAIEQAALAARERALEEAAKIADDGAELAATNPVKFVTSDVYAAGLAKDIGDAIRALGQRKPG